MDPFVSYEETLDPEDWGAMRGLGHRMVDDMLSWLETVRERKVWQSVPAEVKAHLQQPLPLEGEPPEAIYEDFCTNILPYPMGNVHPRFWSWVMGNGTPLGMLAEMLAAGFNPNMGGGEHVGIYVERQVLDWTKEMLGFPQEASGLLVSGGSMANLVALAVARNVQAGFDVRREGLQACRQRLVFYTSSEAHSSIQKAVELLGLGAESLRLLPVDDGFRIDVDALKAAIAADRAAGHRPACIIASAGTVNSGAVDPLALLPSWLRPKGCGSTSTARSARWLPWRPICGRSWPAWNGPTRWRWTSTSGCTCSSKPAACSCAMRRRTGARSHSRPSTSKATASGASPQVRTGRTSTGCSSRATSAR